MLIMKRHVHGITLAIVFLVGCSSDRPETAPVAGKITIAGQAVTTGRIVFHPAEGGRLATSAIGSDGTYQLTTYDTGDGALLGNHKVTITATTGGAEGPKSMEEEMRGGYLRRQTPLKWLVPQVYSQKQTSPLTADVTPGKKTIDFDLPASR